MADNTNEDALLFFKPKWTIVNIVSLFLTGWLLLMTYGSGGLFITTNFNVKYLRF